MRKYIDAEKLIAEIERRLYFDKNWIEGDKRQQMHTSSVSSAYYKRIGSKHACESLLDFVISLQQDQPEVDLDKEITHIWGKCAAEPNDQIACLHIESFIEIARHFYELGLNARKERT